MARPIGFNGILVWLILASGAVALPLRAEEITVTVPPDPPAAEEPAKAASPLPSFTGGDNLKSAATADSGTTPSDAPPATSAKVVKHKPKPAAATVTPTSEPQATAENAGAPEQGGAPAKSTAADGATKPADKTKQASKPSPCKGLDEPTCSANKLCSWIVPASTTPDAAGKVAKAKCRSLAMLKKEAAAKSKSAKAEVLPWAANSTSTPGASNTTTSSTTPSADAPPQAAAVKKTKTAAVKKPKKEVVAPPIPMATDAAPPADGAQEAPSSAPPPPDAQ